MLQATALVGPTGANHQSGPDIAVDALELKCGSKNHRSTSATATDSISPAGGGTDQARTAAEVENTLALKVQGILQPMKKSKSTHTTRRRKKTSSQYRRDARRTIEYTERKKDEKEMGTE